MRIWTLVLGTFAAACGEDVDQGGGGEADPADTDGTTWTPPTYPNPTGPSPDDPDGAETCAILYGGADRIKGDDLWLPEGTEPREIQVWIRTESPREQVAFSYGRASSQQGMLLGTTDGGLPMIRAGMGTDQLVGETPINDDEWHHLVATWDGANAAIVVDGDLAMYGPLQGDTLEGDAIAGNAPSPDLTTPWVGWVDDVRVFAGHREPTDIAADPEGVTLPAEDLKLWWDFEVDQDEHGIGVAVPDLSGFGNDGTSLGTPDTPEFPPCR
jgi:hypothetical protein